MFLLILCLFCLFILYFLYFYLLDLAAIIDRAARNTTVLQVHTAILNDVIDAFRPPVFKSEDDVTKWVQAYDRFGI
jgi:hypothetical protein